MTSALALARMEAQIARQIDEYNKRPRKTVRRGARLRVALRDVRRGLAPEGRARRQPQLPGQRARTVYGSLRVTVSIKPDGSIEEMQVDRPSEHKILNEAALKIVRLAAPYAPFPPEIRRDTDILVITRTWTFAPGDKLYNE